jgi:CCR4-NOT transcription complex subunit 1
MEVFQKYFSRLVVGNAPQIFPGLNRSVANPGNYQILVSEVHKVSHDVDQAGKIAESIETANEELFRDFDLSTFMEHFKLDALEKTILALAFKTTSRSDLKTKGMLSPLARFPVLLSTPANVSKPMPFYPPTSPPSYNPSHRIPPNMPILHLPFLLRFSTGSSKNILLISINKQSTIL